MEGLACTFMSLIRECAVIWATPREILFTGLLLFYVPVTTDMVIVWLRRVSSTTAVVSEAPELIEKTLDWFIRYTFWWVLFLEQNNSC